jgi:hypothetical protein
MGERVLIGCFSSHLRWYNNLSYLFLSGKYKRTYLHQILIEVIINSIQRITSMDYGVVSQTYSAFP